MKKSKLITPKIELWTMCGQQLNAMNIESRIKILQEMLFNLSIVKWVKNFTKIIEK